MNSNLSMARRNKNDEFYTQSVDIEKELRHYPRHFKNKVVYCNCDDPYESAFFEYFTKNFELLGLKKLITTCYKSQWMDLFSQNDPEQAIKLEYTGAAPNKLLTPDDIGVTPLKGDGDFRSQECIDILKKADIVVTNPPFSLFREYVSQLIEHDKQFIIVGSLNAVTYKDVFPYFHADKIWFGATMFKGGAAYFIGRSELYDSTQMSNPKHAYIEDGKLYWRVNGVRWFTNLDFAKRHEDQVLYEKYSADKYPTYDNYDAIEVNKVKNIPGDYDGVMGVPISFFDKYNPNQFEIIGCNRGVDQDPSGIYGRSSYLNGKETFKRLFIRNHNPVVSGT